MKLVLAISTLGSGGAERVMTLLADALAQRGHDVSLVTLAGAEADFFRTDSRVTRVPLGLLGTAHSLIGRARANVRRVLVLRRTIRSLAPKVVVSFVTEMNVITLIACIGLSLRVIVSERVDPRSHDIGRVWSFLRNITYVRADALVAQTRDVAAWFRQNTWFAPTVVVIPNPVGLRHAAFTHLEEQRVRRYILGAGRLVAQKGFDVLIHAFALLAEDCPDVDLVVAGEGSEERALRALIDTLGLRARVFLAGRVQSLDGLMSGAVAFVLSSRYEGFPNVLLEALACGVPSVATDCPSGPREILRDGAAGLLVARNDPEAIARALRALLADPALRERLRSAGYSAASAYRVDEIANQWEAILEGRQCAK